MESLGQFLEVFAGFWDTGPKAEGLQDAGPSGAGGAGTMPAPVALEAEDAGGDSGWWRRRCRGSPQGLARAARQQARAARARNLRKREWFWECLLRPPRGRF